MIKLKKVLKLFKHIQLATNHRQTVNETLKHYLERMDLIEPESTQWTLVVLAIAVYLHMTGNGWVVHESLEADVALEGLGGLVPVTQHVTLETFLHGESLPTLQALVRFRGVWVVSMAASLRVFARVLDQLLLLFEASLTHGALQVCLVQIRKSFDICVHT